MEIAKEFRKQVVKDFINANKCHRRTIERCIQDTGIYRSQHQLLMYTSRNPNRSQTEIAEGMGITPATVAVSIKKLEKAGYIEKRMDDKDNRFNQIELTEKGVAVVHESHLIFDKIEEAMFKKFTKEELEKLQEFMNRIRDNLSDMEL